MGVVIDMNERERDRIVKGLRALIDHAETALAVLEAPRTTEDWDHQFVTAAIVLALDAPPVRELIRIAEDSAKNEAPDTPGDLL